MKPTTNSIEEAVMFIRQSASRQMESAQTIMDGAILAAEQVQDKRLEVLEQGPEVTGFDIFIDFALSFILDSPLAGIIFRAITMKLLVPRVHANQVAKAKALRMVALKSGTLAGGRLPIPQALAASQLARELEELHRFEKILFATGAKEGPYPYMVALAKSARKISPEIRRPSAHFEPSDTPGVAILDLAQQHLSKQKLSIQLEHNMFELWVRTGQMSLEEVYRTLSWEVIEVNGKEISLAEVKDHYKRYFELLIWTLLLYEKPLTGKYVTTRRQSFTLKGYVQPSLIEYWLKRFLNPETEKPFSATPALKRPGEKPNLDTSISALGNYMWKIAESAAKNRASLISAGPLVPRASLLD